MAFAVDALSSLQPSTPTAPEKGWLQPALDKAAERAAEMPDWMTRRATGGDAAAATPLTYEQERKNFEDWFEADAMPSEHSNWFKVDTYGDYEFDFVNEAWKGWFARSEASRDVAQPAREWISPIKTAPATGDAE
jgi:hypothetical protein